MSAESGGGGCEWNTDGYPEANTFEAPSLCLSHFYFFLFFFFADNGHLLYAATQTHWRMAKSRVDDQVCSMNSSNCC